MKKIRWGILGTARIAEKSIIPAIKKSKNSVLQSIASRNINKAKKFSFSHSIPNYYGSYKDLYQDPKIDAIYNPLPNHLHLKSSIEAANCKKHILIEKPISLKSKDVDKLIYASKENKVLIVEAFMIRHHPQWIWVKKKIKDGSIGKINSIFSSFSYFNKDKNNIRNIKKYGGGSLYDIGCYPIAISRFLLEKEPQKVIALANFDKKFKIDNIVSGIMKFGDVHSTFTVSSQSSLFQKVIISGTKKTIIIENPFNSNPKRQSTIIMYDGTSIYRDDNKLIKILSVNQYENQITNFSNCILNNKNVNYDLKDAKNNMKVIDSFFLSIKSSKWVNLI